MSEIPVPIAVAVVESHDRFLIGQRPRGTALAGMWEFPGGKVGAAESPEEAAARECLEETGLAVEVTRLLLSCTHRYDHGHLQLYFFACAPRDPRQTLRTNHRWVKRSELTHYQFPAANDVVLEMLLHS